MRRDQAYRCFIIARRVVPVALPQIGLAAHHAEALATLVPLLGCGEEAAVLAFDGLADRHGDALDRYALNGIAEEERVHDALLTGLARALPPVDAVRLRVAARRFHADLGEGSTTAHLARIAAVDAGVCTVLSRLMHAGRPLAGADTVHDLFARIRNDESRHVAVSRRLAMRGRVAAGLRDQAAAARSALANVLALAGASFDALAVDPDRLLSDISRLPDGLLAA